MERLTEEKQIGPFASLKDKAEVVPGAFGTYDCLYAHMVAVTRLKQYEDTGLEPEEITTSPYGCVFYCNRKCNLDDDFCAEGPGCPYEINAETAKHLLELAQAEKDGRLMVLPEKIGTKVYGILYRSGYYELLEWRFNLPYCGPDEYWLASFETEEEAEAEKKKREGADNEKSDSDRL